MSEREVRTQPELDAALADGVLPVCVGAGRFEVRGSVQVRVAEYGHLVARDGAIVDAEGTTEVEAFDCVEVRARGSAVVHAFRRAVVWLEENAEATVEEFGASVYDPGATFARLVCPVCVSEVEGWRCINSECGLILCPICADGSVGSSLYAPAPCRHYVATLPGDLELADGPLFHERDVLPAAPGVSAEALEVALGNELELARTIYEDGFDARGSLVRLYELLVSRVGGQIIASEMTGWIGWAWRDVFVPDREAFERELRDTAERMRTAVLEARVSVDAKAGDSQ